MSKELLTYLGASEPMKDLNQEEFRYRSFEVKKVEKFTQNHLRPFSKRPPGTAMLPGEHPRLSAVLLEDVDDRKWKQEKKMHDEEMLKNQKKHDEELWRQMSTRPLNFIYNHEKVTSLVGNSYEKRQKNQNQIDNYREDYIFNVYNEKLSVKDPKLLENLMAVEKKTSATAKRRRKIPDTFSRMEETPLIFEETPSSSPPSPVDKIAEPSTVKLVYNERVLEVPRDITCRRCNHFMRICMRRCMYLGVIRQYATYRCARKQCQTFRSTRKVILNPLGPFSEQFNHSKSVQEEVKTEVDEFPKETDNNEVPTAEGLRDAIVNSRIMNLLLYQRNFTDCSDNNQDEEHDPYDADDMEEPMVFEEEKKPDWDTLQQLLR